MLQKYNTSPDRDRTGCAVASSIGRDAAPAINAVLSARRIDTFLSEMMRSIRLSLPDEAATRRLGARLGAILRQGDIVALAGDLGAGKTTLARGVIQAALGSDEPVPSPTFTLVQIYERPESGEPAIWHFDLYRLTGPEELVELGWVEALEAGISLVEWPDRAGDALPDEALRVELREDGAGRIAIVSGSEQWMERCEAGLRE